MELTTLCTVVAALRLRPNRAQFFQYESPWLSCPRGGASPGWGVMRNTSRHTNQACVNAVAGGQAGYFLSALYRTDSGAYWCQSAAGPRGPAVHIAVAEGPVILESPALPLEEGVDVRLSCRTASSGLPANFYRDGVLVGSSATGHLTLRRISRAEGGVYRCSTGAGESPESQLTVMARGPAPSPESSCCKREDAGRRRLLLPAGLVGAALLLAAILLLCIWRRHRGFGARLRCSSPAGPDETDREVSYTVVSVGPKAQPRRVRGPEAADTVYSTVKLTGSDTSWE